MASRAGRERGEVTLTALVLEQPSVLAVSGGADSMVMASLLYERDPASVVALATFDHGTGTAAVAAAAMVQRWGTARGIPVQVGHATALPRTESAWRRARWRFLAEVSAAYGAPIATAHTEDDQAETVFMRLLRQSGVRGLAGLLAPGAVLRPLLGWSRGAVRVEAAALGVPYLEDPSNRDLRHLRNRVRLELLPALERSSPGFRDWLLDVGRRAAAWRVEVASATDRHWQPDVAPGGGGVRVPRDRRRIPSRVEAALFWPEVAGRVGITLDWRGTDRLASFTTKVVTGLQMPLSGGAIVTSSRTAWSLQRAGAEMSGELPADRLAPPEG
jgi:tRNA(Ile)-lysidine synthase